LSRGSTRTTRLRDVFDAILYMATTGCQWRMLPNDFPPVSTVRGYFYAWRNDGLLHEMNRASGRGPEIPANGGLHRLPKRGNY
jgi:transposase